MPTNLWRPLLDSPGTATLQGMWDRSCVCSALFCTICTFLLLPLPSRLLLVSSPLVPAFSCPCLLAFSLSPLLTFSLSRLLRGGPTPALRTVQCHALILRSAVARGRGLVQPWPLASFGIPSSSLLAHAFLSTMLSFQQGIFHLTVPPYVFRLINLASLAAIGRGLVQPWPLASFGIPSSSLLHTLSFHMLSFQQQGILHLAVPPYAFRLVNQTSLAAIDFHNFH